MGRSFFDEHIKAFSQLGGMSVEWEFQFRVLAENCGIEVSYVKDFPDGAKRWNTPLSKVIEDFKKKFPYYSFNFNLMKDLRDFLAHSNFYEFVRTLERQMDSDLRTSAVAMNLSTKEMIHSKAKHTKEQMDDMKTFGSFIIGFNQKTYELGFRLIGSSILGVTDLLELKAYSYDFDYFGHAFKEGKKFTEKEFAIFDEFRKKLPSISNVDPKEHLSKFNVMIGKA